MKHKKCIINLLNKYKNIKNNYKNIGTRSNNINKKLNKIDNNSKKSAKLSWTDKIESKNYKHKITPVKVDILTTNQQTKINKWKEDMLTFYNKMLDYGKINKLIFFINQKLKIWKKDHSKKSIICWKGSWRLKEEKLIKSAETLIKNC